MSDDSGVFILVTQGESPDVTEYRVKYLQNIDSIYGPFNAATNRWAPNKQNITRAFMDSETFLTTDIEQARQYAYLLVEKLKDSNLFLEYGICFISDFKNSSVWDITEPLK